MLSDAQVAGYARDGYLVLPGLVPSATLTRLQQVTGRLIEAARDVTVSTEVYDLDDGHSADAPRLTRIKLPHLRDPVFRALLWASPLTEVLTDLLGPDTVLQTSKLNCKAGGGGAAVEWHQDWAFYPHTNDAMLAIGVLLEDVTDDNGPLLVIPGSHRGPVLDHHRDGVFCGAVDVDDPLFTPDRAVALTAPAGSVTIHHVRCLHGSAPNRSKQARKILFYECHAADAWPLLGAGSYIHELGQRRLWADITERMVTGRPCLTPRMADVPVRVPLPAPPDASSIFRVQASGRARSAFS